MRSGSSGTSSKAVAAAANTPCGDSLHGLDLTLAPLRFLRPCSSASAGAIAAPTAGTSCECTVPQVLDTSSLAETSSRRRACCALGVTMLNHELEDKRVQPVSSLVSERLQHGLTGSPPVTRSVREMFSSMPPSAAAPAPGGGRCASCSAPASAACAQRIFQALALRRNSALGDRSRRVELSLRAAAAAASVPATRSLHLSKIST